MKLANFLTALELAVALVFLGAPVQAYRYPAMAVLPAEAETSGGPGTPASGFFVSHYGAADQDKMCRAEAAAAPVITKENKLKLPEPIQQGMDYSQKGRLSEAFSEVYPKAVIRDSKTIPLTGESLGKTGAKPEKPVEPRKKRVSRLQEPGEAMGGGKEKHLADEAKRLEAQAIAAASAD